ncbi:MAG: hypothetical protein R6X29_05700 [Acidimicrobiia bacterium]|jgi:hypothetical protein
MNAGLLWAVNNLIAWRWPPFLTDDFARALPLINLSLVASIGCNLVYMAHDPPWFKTLSQAGLAAIALAATIRLYTVFPFDLSATGPGPGVVRVFLLLAMFGSVVAIISNLVGFTRELVRLADRE